MPNYQGWDGILGTRASFMLDVVCLGMAVIIPLLFWSIRQSERGRRYGVHKWTQMGLSILLLVVVAAFELEMRLIGWRHRAEPSPYYSAATLNIVNISLWIHLVFSISTFFIWTLVLVAALRKFPTPPQPNAHANWHRKWGKIAAVDMTLTAVTGWIFYYLAFVASK